MANRRFPAMALGMALGLGSALASALPLGSPGAGAPGPVLTPLGGAAQLPGSSATPNIPGTVGRLPGGPGLPLSPAFQQRPVQPIGSLLEALPLSQPLNQLPARIELRAPDGRALLVDVEVEDGWRAVEREWLVLLSEQEWTALLTDAPQLAPLVLSEEPLAVLGKLLIRLRVPPELDSPTALSAWLPAAVRRQLDRNHVFTPQAESPHSAEPAAPSLPFRQQVCPAPLEVGMIDTAIDRTHPAFAGLDDLLVTRDFLVPGTAAPLAHGTAVAGLLVGRGGGLKPLLPGARLHAASVFYRQNALSQGATLGHLLQAMDWLLEQGVPVINMSLAGPDNQVLRQAVASVLAREVQIIAAAGNAGPAAPAQFPAAYPGVIAATAVDAQARPYRWAGRGEHIDFAAQGVGVLTARTGGGHSQESGTSMAAPVVTAFMACALNVHAADARRAREALIRVARDIGEPGFDPVSGHGLLDPVMTPFPLESPTGR